MSELKLGIYRDDLKRVLKYLKADLKDDWFQDPLLYKDIMQNEEFILNYFEKNIKKNHGVYIPTKRQMLNIPKKGFVLRYSLETSFFDRIAFHSFGLTLMEHFDKMISKRILNHRIDYNSIRKKNDYLFKNSIEQWKKFEEYVRVDAENKVILETDLQNYYENINIDKLKGNLENCLENLDTDADTSSRLNFCIHSITNCLKYWMYDNEKGLPQNRDISSFLANIYMMLIDKYMIDNGYEYFRYMDDIKIVCSTEFEARKALKELIVKLREFGLSVNTSKTNIFIPKTDEHFEFINSNSIELERIDSMLKSKKKLLVLKAFNVIQEKVITLINNDDVRSREFRFYIARISKMALCEEVLFPKSFFTKITEGIINKLEKAPEISDQIYTYLTSVNLNEDSYIEIIDYLTDKNRSIYSWQNYLLWKLLVIQNYKSEKLIKYSKEIIEDSSSTANLCGATLYLGQFGKEEEKLNIYKNFEHYNNFFVQRSALIGLQQVPFREVRDIKKHITPETFGMLRVLKEMSTPKYVNTPEKISYKFFINEVEVYG